MRDFVNTVDLEARRDELDTPAALRGWLAGRELAPATARAGEAELRDALALREALRVLLAANNGGAPSVVDASATLDRLATGLALGVRLSDGEVRIEPRADGVAGGLGQVLAAAASAMADGSWRRLKACRSDICRWAFIDEARNHSRQWCSMAVCGNRQKARAYRSRRA
ncbi:MAG TPA: CGNR zinc finger domain-containing protein [Gaiellaceae bacterium]